MSGNLQNHYEALCTVLDAPELLADPRFKDVRSRNAHSAELKRGLAKRFARSAPQLERQLMEADCPAAVVRTTAEAVQMPRHLQVGCRGLLAGDGIRKAPFAEQHRLARGAEGRRE
jgi:crotonobetainyl-CoA:carnitine CoA-transferase CaiB-like acyl-CoA transferase